jgi:hypothetical protein
MIGHPRPPATLYRSLSLSDPHCSVIQDKTERVASSARSLRNHCWRAVASPGLHDAYRGLTTRNRGIHFGCGCPKILYIIHSMYAKFARGRRDISLAYGFNSLTGPHIGRLAALPLPRLQLPVAVSVARQLPALDGQEAAAPGAQGRCGRSSLWRGSGSRRAAGPRSVAAALDGVAPYHRIVRAGCVLEHCTHALAATHER